MELIDLNRQGGIGANATFAQIGPFRVLIDSGLHPKLVGAVALPAYARIEDEPLDLICLTHAHLDHLGSLPIVARQHPRCPVITTYPNSILAPRMLRNSINVMKRQRFEHGLTDYPLFGHKEVGALAKRILVQRYERSETYRKDGQRLEVTLHPAGHVAGACAVELRYKGRRILFSGDVLFEAQRTLPGAHLPSGPIDTVVLETTRGATERALETNRASEVDRLYDRIRAIIEGGGSCLMPVFALGRMQEMFKLIHEGQAFGRIPQCPVFATGLGMDLARMFDQIRRESHLIDFDLRMLEQMKVREPDPNLVPGRPPARSGLYILSSGMLVEHTPSYKMAASVLADPASGICFVGYCDPDTPGGKLIEAGREQHSSFFFDAYETKIALRAQIDRFDLSGHADRDELVDYAAAVDARCVVLNHGEASAREWFAAALGERMPQSRILDPSPEQRYTV